MEAESKMMKAISEPPRPLRDSWGESPEAEAGQRAMMDLAGGPAPMREDSRDS